MPEGIINYNTYALGAVSGSNESDIFEFSVQLNLVTGQNVLAVEIHQINGTSSDISFDLSLSIQVVTPEIISLNPELPVTLTESASYTAHFQPTGACLLPGEITSDMTLTADCSPYLAGRDVLVLPGVSLTVEPGVEIWFSENTRMVIRGDLQVNGTDSLGVLFRENADFGDTHWGNLTFDNSTGINHLNYLEIRNATKGEHPVHHSAAISGWYSEIVLDHVTLTDNFGDPIYGEYADISLTNSLIHSDVTGDLINIKYGDAYISDCRFLGNDSPDTDAIDYDEVVDGVIRNSSIEGFFGFNSDGVDLGEQSRNILIENCFINDCTDKGISIGQGSDAVIRNNTIVNCNLGLGLKDLGAALVDHNSFYSNVRAISAFEKNPGFGGGVVTVKNSILSNSSDMPMFVDEFSVGMAENNFYDTGIMPGTNNEWIDPKFVDPVQYNFELQPGTAGIGAGLDGENMGTLDFRYESKPRIMISDIQYFHPDDPEIETLKILNPGTEMVDISGYSLTPGIEFVFPEGTKMAGGEKITLLKNMDFLGNISGQVFEWTSGKLANEGELLLLRDEHGIVIDHVSYGIFAPWPTITLAGDYISLAGSTFDNHFGANWTLVQPTVNVEETNKIVFRIFPNPASTHLYVTSLNRMGLISIKDSFGANRLEVQPGSERADIDLRSLNSGMYFVLIDGKLAGRFIKI